MHMKILGRSQRLCVSAVKFDLLRAHQQYILLILAYNFLQTSAALMPPKANPFFRTVVICFLSGCIT